MRLLEDIPDHITARVVARCGTPHPFAGLDPVRTALVVVDLQNAFMDDAVGHAVCPMARDIVPEVNRLAGAVRASGGGVFWIMNTVDARTSVEWSVVNDMTTPAARARREAAMCEGSKGQQLWPDLDVRPEDEIVRKYRFSAFLPGASDLPAELLTSKACAVVVPDASMAADARKLMCDQLKAVGFSDVTMLSKPVLPPDAVDPGPQVVAA